MSYWRDESPESAARTRAVQIKMAAHLAWAARNGYRVPRSRRGGRMSAATPAGGVRLRVW